jgi:uncharacterized membrane protein YgaE (UPF0421/DUF939 family)
LSFSFSPKLKFAVKTSLAMMLAYLIPFSQGWTQPQTSVITILLIAVAGPVGESISKGVNRVLGTILGAIIGMILIALFPQDRMLYLLFLSLFVSFFLYLTRAYKADMTVFMLTAVTMMMVFKNGDVDDVFLYGIDRTYMTIIGIVIYTLIAIFIWPVKSKDNTLEHTMTLLGIQSDLYTHKSGTGQSHKTLYEKLQSQEKILEESVITSDTSILTLGQKNTLMHQAKKINEYLILLSYHKESQHRDKVTHYVSNYTEADKEIQSLFGALQNAIKEQKEIYIPPVWYPKYQTDTINSLPHTQQTVLNAIILEIEKLHYALRMMAEKFNAIISPSPTYFTLDIIPIPSKFNWFDIEDLKGTLISFLIFWLATAFWIYINPPAGFLIVTLATALSVLTTFSPLKPSLLIIIFTFSFVFATAAYILVLPNIHYSWELGLFIFIYAFIGFYFIKAEITLFFLIAMVLLNITNTMYYNFNLFLMILFVFYLFLFILLFFDYIPFNSKPESLFLRMKSRFFRLSSSLMQRETKLVHNRDTFTGAVKAWYAHKHLMMTTKKMQLWASKIDSKYFNDIDHIKLLEFTKACEIFAYFLEMMYHKNKKNIDNPLLKKFFLAHSRETLSELLTHYAQGKEVEEIDTIWKDKKQVVEMIEKSLQEILSDINSESCKKEDIISFYESISLRRNVWLALLDCQSLMAQLNFKILERSRF